MVIMENIFRLRELWTKIDNLHLKFLDLDESNEKIETRTELEDYIQEYLFICSHGQKFTLQIVYDVLLRSAIENPNFSAYKAATGFNAIQLYANNLLSQPWRKEYRQIRRYSGFYKHQIESNLVNADAIFEAMGYRNIGNSTFLLDGPVEPDKVIPVSKDCLIAYVECQIVKVIWEELSQTPNCPITWLEILDFRKKHQTCSLEQSIKAFKYQYQQRRPYLNYCFQQQQVLNPGVPTGFPIAEMQCCQSVAAPPIPPPPFYQLQPVANHMMRPQFSNNGYYYNSSVPTAQLIEVEQQHRSDTLDSPSITRNSDSQYEDWDYVYRTLENQGYNKDLGERGDVLNTEKSSKKKDVKKSRKESPSSSYDNLPPIQKIKENDKKKKDENENRWQCAHCTFLNENGSSQICEMCGKSRIKRDDDDDGSVVGGAECETCTLVNPKEAKKCQACKRDLKNSATRV